MVGSVLCCWWRECLSWACRRIPGYPKVDRDNDYLMARFDGAVLDGKPWGRGAAVPGPLAFVPRNAAEEALSRLEVAASLCSCMCPVHPPAVACVLSIVHLKCRRGLVYGMKHEARFDYCRHLSRDCLSCGRLSSPQAARWKCGELGDEQWCMVWGADTQPAGAGALRQPPGTGPAA